MLLYRTKEVVETPWVKTFAWLPTRLCIDDDKQIYEYRWLETIETKNEVEIDSLGFRWSITVYRKLQNNG